MSNYTIKLGDILKNMYLRQTMSPQEFAYYNIYSLDKTPYEIIEAVRADFFDFDYGIISTHKEMLEKKILAHYYNREICVEMPEHFRFLLRNELSEIMPYYNKMYSAIDIEFSPYDNVDIKETTHTAGNNQSTNTNTNNQSINGSDTVSENYDNEIKKSDTPQGRISDIQDDNYMSEYENDVGSSGTNKTSTTTSNGSNTGSQTGNYNDWITKDIKGTNGKKSKSQLLKEYENAIFNVDLMIIEKLAPLFMGIF